MLGKKKSTKINFENVGVRRLLGGVGAEGAGDKKCVCSLESFFLRAFDQRKRDDNKNKICTFQGGLGGGAGSEIVQNAIFHSPGGNARSGSQLLHARGGPNDPVAQSASPSITVHPKTMAKTQDSRAGKLMGVSPQGGNKTPMPHSST